MSNFVIKIKTAARKNAGTNANVYIQLTDTDSKKSTEFHLDAFWSNDFERGQEDEFPVTTAETLSDIQSISLWRDKGSFYDLFDDWNVECITVEDVDRKKTFVFPCHRWIEADNKWHIALYDSSLPFNDLFKEQRKAELEKRREMYKYAPNDLGLPLSIELPLPEEETFEQEYRYSFTRMKREVIADSLWEFLWHDNKTFDSFKEIVEMYERMGKLPLPPAHEVWQTDTYFGHQRLGGSNPKVIKLCQEIPNDSFPVSTELVERCLEGSTLADAMKNKKIYMIDLTMLQSINKKEGIELPNPYALFYVNKAGDLVPIAIQLYPTPGPQNPIFYPSDDPMVWLCAKMWYNTADANYHQSTVHLGATHLVMGAISITTNRHLSKSHPIYQLLEPHFIYLLAINVLAVAELVNPGGWVDRSMATGAAGLLEVVAKRYTHYQVNDEGDLENDFKKRGVEDTTALPNYHYRDDALLINGIIKEYVTDIVKLSYPEESDLAKDEELQGWAAELVKPKNEGIGLKGMPGDGQFVKYDDLVTFLTYMIFTCSVEHAAVNFNQYNDYGFPPGYPGRLLGKPPTDKTTVPTEKDLCLLFGEKKQMLNIVTVTKILSNRGTQPLGDFEVQFLYRPEAVAIVEKFREQLKAAGETIKVRNETRKYKYDVLDPAFIPNAISI